MHVKPAAQAELSLASPFEILCGEAATVAGTLGCLLSHRRALERARLLPNEDHVLILEDIPPRPLAPKIKIYIHTWGCFLGGLEQALWRCVVRRASDPISAPCFRHCCQGQPQGAGAGGQPGRLQRCFRPVSDRSNLDGSFRPLQKTSPCEFNTIYSGRFKDDVVYGMKENHDKAVFLPKTAEAFSPTGEAKI